MAYDFKESPESDTNAKCDSDTNTESDSNTDTEGNGDTDTKSNGDTDTKSDSNTAWLPALGQANTHCCRCSFYSITNQLPKCKALSVL